MPGFNSFLKRLTDHEFSFVYVYRYNNYQRDNRLALDEALSRCPHLSVTGISEYVRQAAGRRDGRGCLCCSSLKSFIRNRCVICGHLDIPPKISGRTGIRKVLDAFQIRL